MNNIMWLDIAWFLYTAATIVYVILYIGGFYFSKSYTFYITSTLSAIDAVLIIAALVFRKLIV